MANEGMNGNDPERTECFGRAVECKAARKERARRGVGKGVWFGLGMMGLVGWSVAGPTLAGIALGMWIDRRWPSPISWTLTLLLCGLVAGCITAWYWVKRESGRK